VLSKYNYWISKIHFFNPPFCRKGWSPNS